MQIIRLPVGMLQANCYLVAEAGGDAVVIDPGAEAERIIEAVRSPGPEGKTYPADPCAFRSYAGGGGRGGGHRRGYSGAGGGLARPDGSAAQPVPMMPGGGSQTLSRCRGSCGTERWWRQAS